MNQNDSFFNGQKMPTVNFNMDRSIVLNDEEFVTGISPIERLFRQSGRTSRMMAAIFEYKANTAAAAMKIYPMGLPEIVKTVVVFMTDAAAKIHQDRLLVHGKNYCNIHCVSVESKEFRELWEYVVDFQSPVEKRPDTKMLNVLVDDIREFNVVLRQKRNIEIVLDHEVYEKAYANVINRFMDFSIAPYRLAY